MKTVYAIAIALMASTAQAGYAPITDDGPYLSGKTPATTPQPAPVCYAVIGRDGSVLYWTGSPALRNCVPAVKDGTEPRPAPKPPTECSFNGWTPGVQIANGGKKEKECA